MEKIKKYFAENDRLGRHLGVEILDVKPGWAKCKLDIKDYHLNGVGIVHGGTIFSLADVAFAVAVNSHGTVTVAINVSINFIKAAAGHGVIYAEAREIARNPKLSHCEIDITDQNGDLIARFTGLAYCKNSKLPLDL